jgi:hypothetical protein
MMYPITLLVLVASFLYEEERLTLQHEAKAQRRSGSGGEGMPPTTRTKPQNPHEEPSEPVAPHAHEKKA